MLIPFAGPGMYFCLDDGELEYSISKLKSGRSKLDVSRKLATPDDSRFFDVYFYLHVHML